jgi:hypothetical protein
VTRPGSEQNALRVVRGGLLAATSTALAVSAHAIGHGGLPDTAPTLVMTAVLGWIGTALAGRARGPAGTLAVLGAAQLVLHVVLTDLSPHAGAEMMDGTTMTVAHAAATLVTALVVARADALLLVVATRLRRLLPVSWGPVPIPDGPVRAPLAQPVTRDAVTVLLHRVVRRRGPPAHA